MIPRAWFRNFGWEEEKRQEKLHPTDSGLCQREERTGFVLGEMLESCTKRCHNENVQLTIASRLVVRMPLCCGV